MESKGIRVTLFYINYKYTLEIYKALLINIIYIYNTIIKVKELKALYKELSLDIKFIITRFITYYNKKYNIGLILKEGGKVYFL